MWFESAPWLALLVPWGVLALWLWRQPATPRGVTARFLWPGERSAPSSFALSRRPPMWVMMLLASMLLGIVALAGPAVRSGRPRVMIVLDPSVRLLAKTDGVTARERLLQEAVDAISTRADITIRVAGEDRAMSMDDAVRSPAKAIDTTTMLNASAQQWRRDNDLVVTLSDDAVAGENIVTLSPPPMRNIGIAAVAASDVPRPRVMVRIARTDSSLTARPLQCRVNVSTAGVTRAQAVSLESSEATAVFEVPSLGDEIDVRLIPDDDDAIDLDNVARLLRLADWPRLELDREVPELARRFVATYTAARPATSTSPGIRFTRSSTADRAIVFASNFGGAVTGPLQATPHAVLRDIDLDWLATLPTSMQTPAGDWASVLSRDGRPILAVRESPSRQVWIGVDLPADAVGSVVLLSNGVGYLTADARPTWSAATPDAVGVDWTPQTMDPTPVPLEAGPGIYLEGGGRMVAVNVSAVVDSPAAARPAERPNLASRLHSVPRARGVSLSPWLAGAASALAIAGGALRRWRGPTVRR